MFWSSPSADLEISIFLLIVALITSIIIYAVTKKIFASILVMSILSNLILYIGIDFIFAKTYNAMWLFKFSQNIWPYINILLAIALVSFYSYEHYKAEKNN